MQEGTLYKDTMFNKICLVRIVFRLNSPRTFWDRPHTFESELLVVRVQ